MQIAVQNELALSGEWSDEFLDMEDDRVHLLRRIFVPTVQILPTQTAPIVSIDYSVDIDHWKKLENKIFTKCARLRCIADEELDDAFHHPG